jgi:hypothetical protein
MWPSTRLGEVLGADRGDGSRAHVGEPGRVDNRNGASRAGVEQVEEAHLRRQSEPPVIDEIADDLDTRERERRDVTAEHVEVTVERCIGHEMHPGLDHRLAAALRREAGLDRGQDLVVGQCERRNVGTVEVIDHQGTAWRGRAHGRSVSGLASL